MRVADGKRHNTRVFTKNGIYEVARLAQTKKAYEIKTTKEFRAFMREKREKAYSERR